MNKQNVNGYNPKHPLKEVNNQNEKEVKILLSEEEALSFFEILCAIPFKDTGSFDWEPPSEREEPVESVISQIQEQIFDQRVEYS